MSKKRAKERRLMEDKDIHKTTLQKRRDLVMDMLETGDDALIKKYNAMMLNKRRPHGRAFREDHENHIRHIRRDDAVFHTRNGFSDGLNVPSSRFVRSPEFRVQNMVNYSFPLDKLRKIEVTYDVSSFMIGVANKYGLLELTGFVELEDH